GSRAPRRSPLSGRRGGGWERRTNASPARSCPRAMPDSSASSDASSWYPLAPLLLTNKEYGRQPERDQYNRTRNNDAVPPRCLEPRTNGLKVRCSTVELEGRDRLKRWKKTLQRFGPEPRGRGYRGGLLSAVGDSVSTHSLHS